LFPSINAGLISGIGVGIGITYGDAILELWVIKKFCTGGRNLRYKESTQNKQEYNYDEYLFHN